MYKLIRRFFFLCNPETIHHIIATVGELIGKVSIIKTIVHLFFRFRTEKLTQKIWGIDFKNPIGIAAGFDKDGHLANFLSALGFGYVEVGSVTAQKSLGNPKPRLFRVVQDEAIINRMGLNNAGAEQVLENIKKRDRSIPIGINIAKTHSPDIMGDEALRDILHSFEILKDEAGFITLNISCPNTTEGKTFEDPQVLTSLLNEIAKIKSDKTVLLKLSADLGEADLAQIIEISSSYKIDGYVVTNTSAKREGLTISGSDIENIGRGGMSGRPIRDLSTRMIKKVYELTKGEVPIIGVGGIDSAETAYEKIKSGASLLQIYTGFIYQGPCIVKKINKGLTKLLERDGHANITQAIGKFHKEMK